jgi:hypothetical protein
MTAQEGEDFPCTQRILGEKLNSEIQNTLLRYHMTLLKSIGVLSVAKISALFGAIMGLINGVLMAIMAALVGPALAAMGIPGAGASIGILSILAGIIIGAILGFIVGGIAAMVYNVSASLLGGIRLDLN